MARWVIIAAGLCAAIAVAFAVLLSETPVVIAAATPERLESIRAEHFHLDASAITQRGSPRTLVLRLEGPAELVPHHFADEELAAPMTIEAWARHLEAPVVFNAGQFDDKLDHLGWFKKDGNWITKHFKGQWKALLLSGPVDGGAWARIADLEQAKPEVEARYRHVIQSMMLVDDAQKVRVRQSTKAACRTVVAEDKRGRVLIIVTEGAVTLNDLALWLPSQNLGIMRAMNLDGGIESQLAVRAQELELTQYGQYGTGTTVFEGAPGRVRYPLPAVIALRPVAD